MNVPNSNLALGPNVQRTLNRVRRTLRWYIVAQVALTVLCWVLFIFWIGALLDYLPVRAGSNETPRWARIVLLAVMSLGSLWVVFVWALPRLLTRIKDISLALLIERQHPEFNNEFVTAVELSEQHDGKEVSNPVAHNKMLQRVHRTLWRQIGVVETRQIFNWLPIWRLGVCAATGVLLTTAMAVAVPDWFELWSRRLFALSNETWPRQAELRADGVFVQLPPFTGQITAERALISFEEGVARIPKGSAVMLQISAEAESKIVPDVCTLFYRSNDGGRGRANLRRIGKPVDGWQQFGLDGPPLDGINNDMHLDVVGLDARLRDLELRTVDPSIITQMHLELEYPSYLLKGNPASGLIRPVRERLAYKSGMRIPQGTSVRLVGEANSVLELIQFSVRSPSNSSSDESSTNPDGRIRTTTPDGSRFAIDLGAINDSRVVEIRLLDQFGLCSEHVPRYVLASQEDTVPDVAARLKGIGSAITPKAMLPIVGTVLDDNAISRVTLEIARSDESLFELELALQNGEDLLEVVDLDLLAEQQRFAVEAGQTIGLVVKAQDYFDLGGETHIGRGQPQLLKVVTDDELLIILDRQELELRQRLDRIINELSQLSDVLEGLADEPEIGQAVGSDQRSAFTSLQDDAELRRMLVFRAQQSVIQGDKSQQELMGVADRVENIRLQLENNRIDSVDRQVHLQEKVYTPLQSVLEREYKDFSQRLLETQTATMSGDGRSQARDSIFALEQVLEKLESVRDSMLDIESFTEIIELVRGLLEEQDQILEETEKAKNLRILELLK